MALNAINLIILFPFMKREEYIANSNAIKLGAGDSLRCYYYSNIYKRSGNLDLFDLSHPKINDMLHAMNTEMNLVHDYETDVYAVDGVIHYVSNTKDKIGEFCADSGQVSVLLMSEVLKYNPDFDYHIKSPWSTTVIENFDGDITISEIATDGDRTRKVEGNGSINFKSTFTGF